MSADLLFLLPVRRVRPKLPIRIAHEVGHLWG